MRRTLHIGQLPAQTVLKRRRVESIEVEVQPATAATESAGANLAAVAAALPASSVDSLDNSANVSARTAISTLPDTKGVASSSTTDDDDDDDETLERERLRLEKLKERKQEASIRGENGSTTRTAAYNSDVVFRRTAAATKGPQSAVLRHSNLQASQDHSRFMSNYFK